MHFVSPTVASDDYIALASSEQLPDAFTLNRRQQCFDIVIINDNFAERDEQFNVTLTNLAAQTNFPRVTVSPDVATIIIEDDDGKHIYTSYIQTCQ